MCFLTKTTWEPTGTWTRYKAHGARGMAKIGKVASEVVAAVQEVSFRQSGLDGGTCGPGLFPFKGIRMNEITLSCAILYLIH